MADRGIKVVISLVTREMKKGLADSLAQLRRWKSAVGGIMRGIGSAFRAVRNGIIAVAGAMAYSIRQYAVQQQAENALAAALAAHGEQADKIIPRMKRYASQIQSQTTIADDAALAVMALGVNMGITSGEIEDATKAAVGLSAAYKIELAEAMRIIAKAGAGYTGTLKRMGIVLDANMSAEQKKNALLKMGMRNYALAAAAATTVAGRFTQLRNAVGDAFEAIGGKLVRGLGLEGVFKRMTEAVERFIARIEADDTIVAWAQNIRRAVESVTSIVEDLFVGDAGARAQAVEDIKTMFIAAAQAAMDTLMRGAIVVGALIGEYAKRAFAGRSLLADVEAQAKGQALSQMEAEGIGIKQVADYTRVGPGPVGQIETRNVVDETTPEYRAAFAAARKRLLAEALRDAGEQYSMAENIGDTIAEVLNRRAGALQPAPAEAPDMSGAGALPSAPTTPSMPTATAKTLTVGDLFERAYAQQSAAPGSSPSNPMYAAVVNADEIGGLE